MHENTCFLTLTYRPEDLKSPWLKYLDFQLFMKRLRKSQEPEEKENHDLKKISYMVTGEYGEENKRPHWHALIYNYRPTDLVLESKNDRGEPLYSSQFLASKWNQGSIRIGDVTIDSANYVARYAAKKLVHGNDQEHPYQPIHKTSSTHALGRTWLEKHYKQTFRDGYVLLPNFQPTRIPRYYVDWCKRHQPETYLHYVTQVRPGIQKLAEAKQLKLEAEYYDYMCNRERGKPIKWTRSKVELTILESKFKKLQERLKL